MPRLTIDGKEFEVEKGKRLVLAIEETGCMIGHRCGGNARCTTCRVEFLAGEPDTMTEAEYTRLRDRGLLGQARLSCQIIVEHDMSVHPVLTTENSLEWQGDNGRTPEPTVMPKAEFFPKEKFIE